MTELSFCMPVSFCPGGQLSPRSPPGDVLMAQHWELGPMVTLAAKEVKEKVTAFSGLCGGGGGVHGRREMVKGLRKGPNQLLP